MITKKTTHASLKNALFFFLIITLLLISNSISPTQITTAQISDDKPYQVFLPMLLTGSGSASTDECGKSNEEWLCRLNHYREMVNLSSVNASSTMSDAVKKHDNYLVLNGDKIVSGIITNYHLENPAYPGYTSDGREAGGQSNIVWYPGPGYTVKDAIDIWITFSSHRYNMFHPDLSASGFDLTCTENFCASSLNVLGSLPASYEYSRASITYPLSNQTGLDTGSHITWAYYRPWTGADTDANEIYFISGSIRNQAGNPVSFTVNEPDHQNGTDDYKNQVALIPNQALASNQTYHVEMTVRYEGQTYSKSWSFTTK